MAGQLSFEVFYWLCLSTEQVYYHSLLHPSTYYLWTHTRTHAHVHTHTLTHTHTPYLQTSKASSQFGVALIDLVPANTLKVPTILEKCLQHIEAHGKYTVGSYLSEHIDTRGCSHNWIVQINETILFAYGQITFHLMHSKISMNIIILDIQIWITEVTF